VATSGSIARKDIGVGESSHWATISIDLDPLCCYEAIFGKRGISSRSVQTVGTRRLDSGDDTYAYDVIVRSDSQYPMLERCFERWLDLLESTGVRATFFVVGNTLSSPTMAKLAKRALEAGHELANHTMSHPYNLRSLSIDAARYEILECDKILNEFRGISHVSSSAAKKGVATGFRMPGYHSNQQIWDVLSDAGYLYDSSALVSWSYYVLKCFAIAKMRLMGKRSASRIASPKLAFSYKRRNSSFKRVCQRAGEHTLRPCCQISQIPITTVSLAQLPLCPVVIGSYPRWHKALPQFAHFNAHAIDLADGNDPEITDWMRKDIREIRPPLTIRGKIVTDALNKTSHSHTWQTLHEISFIGITDRSSSRF